MSHLVIAGGSTGIGRDIVPTLQVRGHAITRLSRGRYAEGLDAIHRHQPIDGLLLCQRYRGPDEWEGEIATSLTATKEMLEWVGSRLMDVSIVLIVSVAAVSVEEEQPVSYHMAKAAMMEMVRYYAVTLGSSGVRVNAILPGLTIKPEAREFYDAHPQLEALYRDITPLGRLGTAADVGYLVDFLVGPSSAYLTGQTIVLDGGISLRSSWALARRVSPTLRDLPVTQRKAGR